MNELEGPTLEDGGGDGIDQESETNGEQTSAGQKPRGRIVQPITCRPIMRSPMQGTTE